MFFKSLRYLCSNNTWKQVDSRMLEVFHYMLVLQPKGIQGAKAMRISTQYLPRLPQGFILFGLIWLLIIVSYSSAFSQETIDAEKAETVDYKKYRFVKAEIISSDLGNIFDRRTYETVDGEEVVSNAEIITKGIDIDDRFESTIKGWGICSAKTNVTNPNQKEVGHRVICEGQTPDSGVAIIFTYRGLFVKSIIAPNLELALGFERQICPRSNEIQGVVCKY